MTTTATSPAIAAPPPAATAVHNAAVASVTPLILPKPCSPFVCGLDQALKTMNDGILPPSHNLPFRHQSVTCRRASRHHRPHQHPRWKRQPAPASASGPGGRQTWQRVRKRRCQLVLGLVGTVNNVPGLVDASGRKSVAVPGACQHADLLACMTACVSLCMCVVGIVCLRLRILPNSGPCLHVRLYAKRVTC